MMQYESKDDAGHKFWTARHGRYVRIDANKPRPLPVDDHARRPCSPQGLPPNRDEAAAAAVQAALRSFAQ